MLARILGSTTHLTSVDLSMNNLSAGLDCLADGIIANDRIVCLKLKNNNIDGRQMQEVLSSLVMNHPSLTSIDLGNTDNIQNRNRIYDEGINGLLDGLIKSEYSLISELHLQSAFITSDGLSRLHMITRNTDL